MPLRSAHPGPKSRLKFHKLHNAVQCCSARSLVEQLEGRVLLSTGDPLVVTTQPPSSIVAGQPFGLVITAENGDGSVNTSFNGNVTLSDSDGHALYGTTTVQAVNGIASFSGLSEHGAIQGDELQASANGLPAISTSSFNIVGAPATHLVAAAPSNVLVNSTFTQTVLAEDQYGNVDTTFNGNVTLALSANPGNATLGGTLTVQAVNGLASFSNLTINRISNGCTLKATTSGFPAVTTAAFNVTDQLAVAAQPPASVTAGTAFGLVVTALDGLGHVDTSFNGAVTVANVPGYALEGVLTVNAVNGVATFAGLAEDQATSYPYLTLSALGLPTVNTNSIQVTAASATHLVTSTPSNTLVNGAFSLTVSAEDPFGNMDPTFSGNVTIALATNPSGATLAGTLTLKATNGVAAFSGLTVNKLGTGYTLTASAPSLRSATTGSFNMTDQLVVTTQPPSTITAGTPFNVVVTAEDGDGKVDTSFNANVSVSDGYGYHVYGATTAQAVNGVASFSALSEHIAISGDELEAASTGVPTAASSSFNILSGSATHLSVTAPNHIVVNGAFGVTVDAEDQFGNVDPAFNGNVTLTLPTNPGNATLGGTLSVQAVKGVATFHGLTINKLGSGYILQASTPNLSAGSTLQFNAADQMVVTTQPPASSDVGTPFDLVVDIEDGDGVVNTSFDGNVTVSDYYGHHVYGTATVQAVSGVASFSGLSEHVAMEGDVLEITSIGLPAAYSNSFNEVQPAATQLRVSGPGDVVVNGAFSLTVDATDQFGNLDPTFNGPVTLALSTNLGTAALEGTLSVQAINGVATFSGLTINGPGSGYALQASAPTLSSATTAAFNATYELVVVTQPPSNFRVDTPFGLAVAVEDGDGIVQASFAGNVTVSDMDGNKIDGATTVQAVHGVASFSDLTESASITGDELEASSSGLPGTFSNPFSVAALTATQLAVAAPIEVVTNGSFSMTVDAVDPSGVVDSTFDGLVTLALSGNPRSATLGGTVTVQAFNGIASFSGLTINKMASGYMLQATAIGLTSATTATFSVTDLLVVTTPPPSTLAAGTPFGLVVAAEDGLGNVDTSFDGAVTISDAIANTLAGALSINAVNGVARFTGLTINTVGNGYTIDATTTGATSATTAPFNVTDLLVVTTQPPSTISAGVPFNVVVTAENGLGNVDTSFNGMVTIADTIGNNLAGVLSVNAINGVASFSGLTESTTISGDSLEVTSSGLPPEFSSPFAVIAVAATQTPSVPVGVVFAQAPSSGVAGSAINPILVNVVDANGDVVTSHESQVTLTISAGPSGANIGGTFNAQTVNGVATFSNVVLNTSGANYTLTASDGLLTTATSGNFAISPAAAAELVFVQQPTAVTAGTAVSPGITVDVEDQFGNLVASDNSTVTLTVSSPNGAMLSGTDSVQASGGVATLGDVILDTAGNYMLTATDGSLTAATSGSFTVSPAASDTLVFMQQPMDSSLGSAISPAITVAIEDPFGNVVSSDNSTITLALGTAPAGASLGGTLSVAAAGGVATFSGIQPSTAGAYTLTAADGALTGATSAGFSVGKLGISTQPVDVKAGVAIPIVVDIQKNKRKVIAADASQVTISIATGPAGAALTGTSTVTAANGVATFNNMSLTEAGTYTLTITAGGISAQTVSFTVAAGAATNLAFAQNPTPVTAGQTITPAITVSVTDSFGNPINGTKVKLAIASGPAGATLSGTLKADAQNGVATFSDVSLTQAGSYTLKATHGSLTAATSGDFTVTAAAADKLVFVQQPTAATVGVAIAPAIAVDVEDTFGNLVTTDDSNVTLIIKPNTGPAGAILDGTLTVAAQNGVALFSDLALTEGGTYKLKAADGKLSKAKSAAFDILAAS